MDNKCTLCTWFNDELQKCANPYVNPMELDDINCVGYFDSEVERE